MIKQALEYIVGLRKRDATVTVGDTVYQLGSEGTVKGSLDRIKEAEDIQRYRETNPEIAALDTTTLSSVAEYVLDDPEGFFAARQARPMIHIANPVSVWLEAQFDQLGRRAGLIHAKAITPGIDFDRPKDVENFIIMLQSCFAENDDRDVLLTLTSKITAEASATLQDDGVSQTVQVRKGAATVGTEKVENPFALAPFRTFIEVPQPESPYVFRIHEGPKVALYEAGGAEWQIAAIDAIKAYFMGRFADLPDGRIAPYIVA